MRDLFITLRIPQAVIQPYSDVRLSVEELDLRVLATVNGVPKSVSYF